VSLLPEGLSAEAEEADVTVRATREVASVVASRLEHSVLDSLRLEGSQGLFAFLFGKFKDCLFFRNEARPLGRLHSVLLD
jgi:hypothetical protein